MTPDQEELVILVSGRFDHSNSRAQEMLTRLLVIDLNNAMPLYPGYLEKAVGFNIWDQFFRRDIRVRGQFGHQC